MNNLLHLENIKRSKSLQVGTCRKVLDLPNASRLGVEPQLLTISLGLFHEPLLASAECVWQGESLCERGEGHPTLAQGSVSQTKAESG
jgi:hypothetical protein